MAGKRSSVHVEGVEHGAPIPMGARVGNMLFSSGIICIDPDTGKVEILRYTTFMDVGQVVHRSNFEG